MTSHVILIFIPAFIKQEVLKEHFFLRLDEDDKKRLQLLNLVTKLFKEYQKEVGMKNAYNVFFPKEFNSDQRKRCISRV